MTFHRYFGIFALALSVASLAAAQQAPPAASQPPAPPAYTEPQPPRSVYEAPQMPPNAYNATRPAPPPSPYTTPQGQPYYAVPSPSGWQLPLPTWAISVSGSKLLVESADGAKAVCE